MSTISTPRSSSAHWRSAVTAGRLSRAAVARQARSPSDRPNSLVLSRSMPAEYATSSSKSEMDNRSFRSWWRMKLFRSACAGKPRDHFREIDRRERGATQILLDRSRSRFRQNVGQQRRAIENCADHRYITCGLASQSGSGREALPMSPATLLCGVLRSVHQPQSHASPDRARMRPEPLL